MLLIRVKKRTISMKTEYPYRWHWRSRLPARKDQPCRILVKSTRMNSILLEFEDGYKVVTSLNAIRRRNHLPTENPVGEGA